MATYSGDPRWITAKWAGVDANGERFKAGDRVFWFPRTKTIYSGEAAQEEAARFEAAKFDEAVMTGQW